MKQLLLLIAVLIVVGEPNFAQTKNAGVTGKVLGSDGRTVLEGATIWIDSASAQGGRFATRERVTTKTGADGRYKLSGLAEGQIIVTLVMDGRPVRGKGPLLATNGMETTVDFDLSKQAN